jgi:hypothetical protein
MTEYLIAFSSEWVPGHTDEELSAKSKPCARSCRTERAVARRPVPQTG